MKKDVDCLLRKWRRERQISAGQLQPLARKISDEIVRRRQQRRKTRNSTDGPDEQKRPKKPDNTRK